MAAGPSWGEVSEAVQQAGQTAGMREKKQQESRANLGTWWQSVSQC